MANKKFLVSAIGTFCLVFAVADTLVRAQSGPFSSYPGQDLNALTVLNGVNEGQPPDVAPDVSPSQNVEFVNALGMYVWAKPALPVPSPAPTPIAKFDEVSFWCGSPGVNNQSLLGCSNGQETLTLTDTQTGYDASLGRWIATELARDATTGIGYLYLAASKSGDASGGWNKWATTHASLTRCIRLLTSRCSGGATAPSRWT